jgi:hypothetical protein
MMESEDIFGESVGGSEVDPVGGKRGMVIWRQKLGDSRGKHSRQTSARVNSGNIGCGR